MTDDNAKAGGRKKSGISQSNQGNLIVRAVAVKNKLSMHLRLALQTECGKRMMNDRDGYKIDGINHLQTRPFFVANTGHAVKNGISCKEHKHKTHQSSRNL